MAGQTFGGGGIEAGGQQFEGGKSHGVGLQRVSEIEELSQQCGLLAECEQSNRCDSLFSRQLRICGVQGSCGDLLFGECDCVRLIVPCGDQAGLSVAETIIECDEQFAGLWVGSSGCGQAVECLCEGPQFGRLIAESHDAGQLQQQGHLCGLRGECRIPDGQQQLQDFMVLSGCEGCGADPGVE